MSGLIALLLKLLPLILSLFGIIPAVMSHQTALSAGTVGANQDYLLYVIGQGLGGLVGGASIGEWIRSTGMAVIRNGEIGYRLRKAAELDASSSDKEIEKCCEKLK